uniref:Uncharacterized protein n=1 Tax=Oryza rufipogon TaxID=4529 RepID=A0A0E0RG93_ORYRU
MQFNAPAAATAPPTKLLVGVRLNGDGVKVEELIRRRRRREQSIRRPLPLLHGSHGLSAPSCADPSSAATGGVRSFDLFLSRSDPVVSQRPAHADPWPATTGGSRSGGVHCGRGFPATAASARAAHTPHPAVSFFPRWWPRWRGDVTRSCLGSRNEGGDGGGKVGLLALDVALAFPQATTSQFPPAGETSLAFPVEKMFASYLAM